MVKSRAKWAWRTVSQEDVRTVEAKPRKNRNGTGAEGGSQFRKGFV